jgi:CRISPR-associated endonuclease Cas3-HD
MLKSQMFFAHSLGGRDRGEWQPLAAHLEAVSRLTSLRAEKFGAARLGAVIGLLHDLGKYAPEFQSYIAGQGAKPGPRNGRRPKNPRTGNSGGVRSFCRIDRGLLHRRPSRRLIQLAGRPRFIRAAAKKVSPLDPKWRRELAPQAVGLFPTSFK